MVPVEKLLDPYSVSLGCHTAAASPAIPGSIIATPWKITILPRCSNNAKVSVSFEATIRAVRRPRRAAAADNLGAPPPPTFVDRRAAAAAADNLSARRRYHCCYVIISWEFLITSSLSSLPSGRFRPPMPSCFSMLSFFFKFAVFLAHHPVQ